jgi:hypothetical protein
LVAASLVFSVPGVSIANPTPAHSSSTSPTVSSLAGAYTATVTPKGEQAFQLDATIKGGNLELAGMTGSQQFALKVSGSQITATVGKGSIVGSIIGEQNQWVASLSLTASKSGVLSGTYTATGASGGTLVLTPTKNVAPAAKASASSSPRTELSLPGDRSFFKFMNDQYAPATTKDRDTRRTVNKESVIAFANAMDASTWQRDLTVLSPGTEATFEKLLAEIDGQSFSPSDMSDPSGKFGQALKPLLAPSTDPKYPDPLPLAVLQFGPIVAMGSGGGVIVHLGDGAQGNKTFFYVLSDRAKTHKGGADLGCYMSTPTHKGPLATSYNRYLKDLSSMPASDDAVFFRHEIEVLASSDASSISKLSPLGQSVSTDFIGIYSAELYRVVTGEVGQWELDMAEVTLIADYVRAAGKVIQLNGTTATLADGAPSYYYVPGGLLHKRPDRQKLQQLVTQAERKLNPSVVSAVESLIGVSSSTDLFHDLASFLNTTKADSVDKQKLIAAADAFLSQVRKDQAQITKFIQGSIGG